jgi:DNA-binding response OmpR family regulator
MTTILLVEDEIKLAEIIQRELEVVGYQVWHAEDGSQALQLFARKSPNMVILDWILPEMDGLEVLRRIRMQSPIPVLMLTARGEPIDRVVGLEVGADDYLVKPFHMSELIARIRALLRHEERIREMLNMDQNQLQTLIKYGTLCLDSTAYSATLNGQPLELTALEFDLLSLLAAHPERTFNRMYLVETIWKSTYLEGDRSVDNAILRLRKKLGPIGDCIETVRGVGYRMCQAPKSNSKENNSAA